MKELLHSRPNCNSEFMFEQNLRTRFYLATSEVFNGLALDLDGTVMEGQEEIDPEIFNNILYLLRSFIPVIIVTGRGFGSTERLIESKLPKNLLRYLFIANYNGAAIRFFDNDEWITIVDNQLEERERIFNLLISPGSPICDSVILDDADFVSKVRPHSITLVFNSIVKAETKELILNFLASNGIDVSVLKITDSGATIDIISHDAGKQNAITQIANKLDLNHLKIARVGDQGQIHGNDSDMLECSSGFSVGLRNHDNKDGCHPVVDESGGILTGVSATKYLLSNIQFDPGCVIDGSNFCDVSLRSKHQRQYDALAESARTKYQEELIRFSERSLLKNEVLSDEARALQGNSGFENIFSFNGAITFSDREIASIPSNWANFIFAPSSSFPNKFKHILKYGSQFYSRGEAFYTTLKDYDHPQKPIRELICLLNSLLDFLPEANQTISRGNLSITEFKILLSYFDHLHIVLMHIFHTASYLEQHNHFGERSSLEELRNLVFITTATLHSLLSLQKPQTGLIRTSINIGRINEYLDTLFETTTISGKVLSKAVRGISETDHPLQNAIYAQALAQRLFEEKIDLNNLIIAGLHYGGVELPFVLDHYLRTTYGDEYISPEYVSVHYSRYSNGKAHQDSIVIEDIIDKPDLSFDGQRVLILDDGVFSAASIQKIGWLFTLAGGNVSFSAMSIANNRRIGQIMDEAGADSSFLEQELSSDFIRVSPYMRVFFPEEYHDQRADHRLNLVKTRARTMLVRTYQEYSGKDPYSILRDETIIRHPISRRNKDLSHLKP